MISEHVDGVEKGNIHIGRVLTGNWYDKTGMCMNDVLLFRLNGLLHLLSSKEEYVESLMIHEQCSGQMHFW